MSIDDTKIEKAVKEALDEAADTLYTQIKQDMPKALAESRGYRSGFEERLYNTWKQAIDLFETIVILSEEYGAVFNRRHLKNAAEERNVVFKVLTSLHARSCLTASEVGALLRSGYAGGALTRQRTLHELAVVGYLIREHGQDLARRYLDHETIESAKAANDYQRNYRRLGYEPLEKRVIDQLRQRRNTLIRQYGDHFDDPYGWADYILRKRHHREDKRFTFTDLEAAVHLEHLRPYYRMASHGTHAGPKGDNFNVGNLRPRKIMLAGPSNAGLADPGHGTLISLLQCTTTLLGLIPDPETVTVMRVLGRLVDEAGQEFLKAHNALLEAEAKPGQEITQPQDETKH